MAGGPGGPRIRPRRGRGRKTRTGTGPCSGTARCGRTPRRTRPSWRASSWRRRRAAGAWGGSSCGRCSTGPGAPVSTTSSCGSTRRTPSRCAATRGGLRPGRPGRGRRVERRPAGGVRVAHLARAGHGDAVGVLRRPGGGDEDADLVDAVLRVAQGVAPVVAGRVVLGRGAGGEGDHRPGGLLAGLPGDGGALLGEGGGGPEGRRAGVDDPVLVHGVVGRHHDRVALLDLGEQAQGPAGREPVRRHEVVADVARPDPAPVAVGLAATPRSWIRVPARSSLVPSYGRTGRSATPMEGCPARPGADGPRGRARGRLGDRRGDGGGATDGSRTVTGAVAGAVDAPAVPLGRGPQPRAARTAVAAVATARRVRRRVRVMPGPSHDGTGLTGPLSRVARVRAPRSHTARTPWRASGPCSVVRWSRVGGVRVSVRAGGDSRPARHRARGGTGRSRACRTAGRRRCSGRPGP